jgi:hypothetical protein
MIAMVFTYVGFRNVYKGKKDTVNNVYTVSSSKLHHLSYPQLPGVLIAITSTNFILQLL